MIGFEDNALHFYEYNLPQHTLHMYTNMLPWRASETIVCNINRKNFYEIKLCITSNWSFNKWGVLFIDWLLAKKDNELKDIKSYYHKFTTDGVDEVTIFTDINKFIDAIAKYHSKNQTAIEKTPPDNHFSLTNTWVATGDWTPEFIAQPTDNLRITATPTWAQLWEVRDARTIPTNNHGVTYTGDWAPDNDRVSQPMTENHRAHSYWISAADVQIHRERWIYEQREAQRERERERISRLQEDRQIQRLEMEERERTRRLLEDWFWAVEERGAAEETMWPDIVADYIDYLTESF